MMQGHTSTKTTQQTKQTSKQRASLRLHTSARLYLCMHASLSYNSLYTDLGRRQRERERRMQEETAQAFHLAPLPVRHKHTYKPVNLSPSVKAHQTLDLPSKSLVIGITPPAHCKPVAFDPSLSRSRPELRAAPQRGPANGAEGVDRAHEARNVRIPQGPCGVMGSSAIVAPADLLHLSASGLQLRAFNFERMLKPNISKSTWNGIWNTEVLSLDGKMVTEWTCE